jgi:hypothetical protein
MLDPCSIRLSWLAVRFGERVRLELLVRVMLKILGWLPSSQSTTPPQVGVLAFRTGPVLAAPE